MLKFKEFCQLVEDGIPANCASGGGVAGIGIGPAGEPGVSPKKKKNAILRGILSTVNIGEKQ